MNNTELGIYGESLAEKHLREKGFQIIQSLLSFQSGGVWGAGLGQGQGKLFFLPEAHTDFLLAVIGEEFGLIGVLCVIGLFLANAAGLHQDGLGAVDHVLEAFVVVRERFELRDELFASA